MRLHTKILLGLVIGTLLGFLSNVFQITWLQALLTAVEPLGTVFIRLLTMIVIPLVVGSLLVGVSSLGDMRKLGRIGGKTISFFLITTVISVSIGFMLARTFQPGAALDPEIRDALTADFAEATVGLSDTTESAPDLVQVLVEMIPRNPFQAAADLDLLPLIIFTLIFGAAVGVSGQRRESQVIVGFFEEVNAASMVVIGWVMRLAPYAVFALIAAEIARFGLGLLKALLFYSIVVVAGLLLQVFGTFLFAIRFLAKMRLTDFLRRIAEPMLLAFSTSSSNATLPVSLEAAEHELGVSKGVAGFVLPLGATLNMNGSGLYKAVTALFIAQVYGVDLSLGQELTVVLTATLAAVAGAGVPGSSLVTTLIVLNAVGLGAHAEVGIALVLGVDRILDMCRTTVNVIGDLACTAFVARSEGEELLPSRMTTAPTSH